MKKKSVEFATSCYEKDWEFLLKTDRLRRMIERCNYEFDKITLYINNVSDYTEVKKYARDYKEKGIIDEYIIVEEYAPQVLKFFNIQDKKGYYYLIQALTAVYLSTSDYLLHFTCDAMLTNEEPWIDQAIAKMEQDKQVIVATALNEACRRSAMVESFDVDENFYVSYGFTDQCCLLKTAVFKADIYNEQNELSLFYPEKSRGAFEERAYRFMRNHKYFRITHRRAEYRHKNFPKTKFKKWLVLNLGINKAKYGIP